MAKFLVVYTTKRGQTKKIANYIRREILKRGFSADLLEIRTGKEECGWPLYDGVVLGAPVHMSSYPRTFQKWIQNNRSEIYLRPDAFFSVCLGEADKVNPETPKAEVDILSKLFEKTQWEPDMWEIFAGALKYTQYNWVLRRIMKKIAAKSGGDTDMSQDYEYTDWNQVKRFVDSFIKFAMDRSYNHGLENDLQKQFKKFDAEL